MIQDLREVVGLMESRWHGVPVLVVGDVMLDQYIWGDVERISPEAPVPVLHTVLHDEKPGGAANVAMNLAKLGACVTVAGFAGADEERQRLEGLLVDADIEPVLTTVDGVPTTTKLRILAGNQQMMRVDTEVVLSDGTTGSEALLQQVFGILPKSAVVVLSDYAKGVLSEAACRAIIGRAHEHNIPVLVDPKSRSFARYRGATTICPNRKELAAATGESAGDVERLLSAGQAMLADLGMEFMVVTLGERGIAVLRPNSRWHAPAVVRQVYDVSGAGDTVVAVLTLALASGMAVESAVHLANIAAGVVVSKVGTVPIDADELLAALTSQIALHKEEKVLSLNRLLARVASWRTAGERIVFTNGCFDLLHIGHITLLEQARRMGDRLIVGLNSDGSVQRIKGPSRPIVGEGERARILAALSAVDAVVIFEESTPINLIASLRPDVLVKGGDYSEADVAGGRDVRAWGGRVELIPLVQGVSTTRLAGKFPERVATRPPTPARVI